MAENPEDYLYTIVYYDGRHNVVERNLSYSQRNAIREHCKKEGHPIIKATKTTFQAVA